LQVAKIFVDGNSALEKHGTEAVPESLIRSLLEMVQPLLTSDHQDILELDHVISTVSDCNLPDRVVQDRWYSLGRGGHLAGWAPNSPGPRVPD
jgi:hypothetical protein